MFRINFLFVLILLLTACTPNVTIAPLPTTTSSPAATEVEVALPISTEPAETVEINQIANPISPENMVALSMGGYNWDAEGGVLKSRDGNNVLSYQDGKWVDPVTGVTIELSALSQVEVSAIYKGHEVGAVLSREVNGEIQIYNPETGVWFVEIDVEGSRQVIDRPDLPLNERGRHSNPEVVVLANLPRITWDDFISGDLYYAELNNLRPPLENVRHPDLRYAKLGFIIMFGD